MSKLQDPDYLCGQQYCNAEKLNARICLHTEFSTNDYGWFRWVFDRINLASRARILELGCGPGDLWVQNLKRIPSEWIVTLSDFSPGMVMQVRENLRVKAHRFRYSIIDAQAIPFERNFFDAVIANHCLYHIPDRQKALSEIFRIIKPGGCFFSSTIGDGHLKEISELVAKFDPAIEDIFRSEGRPFTLENGGPQLQKWFCQVEVDRYPDSLLISEAEPLVAYIASTVGFDLVNNQLEELRAYIKIQIDARGGTITVFKDSGLFTAVKV
jgi:ubiquinone/menaquinone biosynthesis C-methylase UbiE